MNMIEISNNVKELRELARMKEEIENEISALQDMIKAVMTEQNTDEIQGTDFKVTWKLVTSNRIDTTALKKGMPEIAAQFTKASQSRRFVIA